MPPPASPASCALLGDLAAALVALCVLQDRAASRSAVQPVPAAIPAAGGLILPACQPSRPSIHLPVFPPACLPSRPSTCLPACRPAGLPPSLLM